MWIADPPNGRISVYEPNGTFSRHLQLERRPDQIVVPDGGSTFYLAWLSPTKTALFARYDVQGTRVQEYGPVVEDQVERGMALDGWIGVAPDQSLYYTPTRAGRLMKFDRGGSKTLDTKTIDFAPIPEVIVDERGGRRVSSSASIQSLGLQVVGPSVYVFSVLPEGKRQSEPSMCITMRDSISVQFLSLTARPMPVPPPKGSTRSPTRPSRRGLLLSDSISTWRRQQHGYLDRYKSFIS